MNRQLPHWSLAIATWSVMLGAAATSHAQTAAVADGNWSDASTWSAGEPNDTSAATIDGGHTVTIDQPNETTNLLDVGTAAGETGALVMTGGNLTLFDSDGMTEPNLTAIRLGQAPGSTGNFDMSGGDVFISEDVLDVFASGDLLVGDNGASTMTMTGGSIFASDEVFIGLGAGSNGSLSVSGGQIDVGRRNLLVGFAGANEGAGLPGANGSLHLSGDAIINVAGFMFSSFGDGATSAITQTGGTMNVGSAFVLGRRGNSTFDHSGGAVNVTGGNGDFVVGDGGPLSTYNLSGDATANAVNQFLIGTFPDGNGLVNQTGGTVDSGGNMRIGVDGVGQWNLSGGGVNAATNVFLGDYDSSQGTLNVSGGALHVTGNLNVGAALASNAPDDGVREEPNGGNGAQGQALDANGTLIVTGIAGAIDVSGNLLANPADKSPVRNGPGDENDSIIRFVLDSSGVSTIDVALMADLDGAIIDLDDSAGFFSANPSAELTLIDAAGGFGNVHAVTPAEQAGDGMGFAQADGDAGLFDLAIVPNGSGGQMLVATAGVGGVPGDLDGDDDVDGADFLLLQRGFGSQFDAAGFDAFEANFGVGVSVAAAAAAVPEPHAALLLLLATTTLVANANRRPRPRAA